MKQYVFDHDELRRLMSCAYTHGMVMGSMFDAQARKNLAECIRDARLFAPREVPSLLSIDSDQFGRILDGQFEPDDYYQFEDRVDSE